MCFVAGQVLFWKTSLLTLAVKGAATQSLESSYVALTCITVMPLSVVGPSKAVSTFTLTSLSLQRCDH